MDYEPGLEWYYNGGCSHLLSAILTTKTGNSTLDFAREFLFEPLGITAVIWPIDPQGIYFGGQDIWLKPRDMAKFGFLFLNNGTWDGEQIISEDWVIRSTNTSVVLNAYYASGFNAQKIIVVPDYDIVIVFTAEISDHDPEHELVTQFILPAVLDQSDTNTLFNFYDLVPLFILIILVASEMFAASYWYVKRKRR